MTESVAHVDSKGRVTLGKAFANQLVIIQEVTEGILEIMRAKAVPEPELWLYRNPVAIQMVMQGLEQAKAGTLVDGPDLRMMGRLAAEMGN